jgi:tetrahydromethanopterin S-methyltransferase subunit E
MKRNWNLHSDPSCLYSFIPATIILPISEIAKSVMASPAALALIAALYQIFIAALYQIFKDEAAFEKEKKIKTSCAEHLVAHGCRRFQ